MQSCRPFVLASILPWNIFLVGVGLGFGLNALGWMASPYHVVWKEKRKLASTELWGHPNGYYLEAQLTHAQGRMRVERKHFKFSRLVNNLVCFIMIHFIHPLLPIYIHFLDLDSHAQVYWAITSLNNWCSDALFAPSNFCKKKLAQVFEKWKSSC